MTETRTSVLAEPVVLPCGATLPNRLAKAGMSEQLATRDGRPTPELNRLYATWGRGGAGLLVTGNVMIDRAALVEPRNIILDDERALPQIRAWSDAGRAAGSAVWMQINHPGRVATVPFTRRPVGPYASREPVPGFNFRKPRELTGADIESLIRRYVRTAELAIAGGFDGVQIHAAHGYLLAQFLSPLANTRGDRYGRDAAGRRRLLLEVVAAVRAALGPHVPISVKLNSKDFQRGGLDESESLDVAVALADAGIDVLEISGGNYAAPAMTGVHHRSREAYFLDYGTRVRRLISTPLMLTGGLRSRDTMERIVHEGAVDIIGMARPMAIVPDYPARILAGEPEPQLPTGPLHLGYRPADGYIQLAAHAAQLHRIGAGLSPLDGAGLGALARSLGRLSLAALTQATVPR
ncbi:NADH:flavin oxidoreductase/NADH oxidase family protein [Rhodococcus daqingensis]|uniref:NADH:flavin oxidoreductase/NADH oxidase family protein n=1 Tax=Rhodococcus daqingensis TaxID=2479363 RepID=A0ABW2RRI1_9NOCA